MRRKKVATSLSLGESRSITITTSSACRSRFLIAMQKKDLTETPSFNIPFCTRTDIFIQFRYFCAFTYRKLLVDTELTGTG